MSFQTPASTNALPLASSPTPRLAKLLGVALFLFLGFIGIFGTACPPAPSNNDSGNEATPDGQSSSPRSLVTDEGTYRVTYTPSPDPIPLNANFSLALTIAYADGREKALPDDLQLKADATMPEHKHGMKQTPTTTKNHSGSFTIDGMLFHMPGRWVFKAEITAEGKTESVSFDIVMNN